MDPLSLTIVGPGRAGTALGIAASRAGHHVGAFVGRTRENAVASAALVGAAPLAIGDALPAADLLVIAVRDAAISEVAADLVGAADRFSAVVHLSGFTTLRALDALVAAGPVGGSFHPLQTLPTPEAGASRLSGAWIAVTAPEPLRSLLHDLAGSLGATPFDLRDDVRALYHAAAAAAANFPLAALTMAADLFEEADVPFAAARPLVEAVVANAFDLGPRASLTGPVARGDVATVAGQLLAVGDASPEWIRGFVAFVRELARITGRGADFDDVMER